MVKKLLKQEFSYYRRILPIVYIVLFSVALGGWALHFFEADTTAYFVIRLLSIVLLCAVVGAVMILCAILCAIRFYGNLFGKEGYLTLSLPVTIHDQLTAKLGGGVIATLTSAAASLLAFCIFFMGDWLVEIGKLLHFNFRLNLQQQGAFHALSLIAETLILLAVMIIAHLLTYYLCLCIGQQARRGRVLISVGIYYGISSAVSTLSLAILIILFIVPDGFGLETLSAWITAHPVAFRHIWQIGLILLGSAWSAFCFLFCRRTLERKFNLE